MYIYLFVFKEKGEPVHEGASQKRPTPGEVHDQGKGSQRACIDVEATW